MGRQTPQVGGEMDIFEYLRMIYKKRWAVLVIVIAAMLFTGVSSIRQPEMYEASATFFPLSMNYNVQPDGFMLKPQLDIKDMIVSILKSRSMAGRIVEQLELKKLWNTKYASDASMALRSSIAVTFEQNGAIRLSVYSTQPELTAKIANAYVDNLEYFNAQLNITAQKQIVQVIDRAVVPDTRMPRNTVKKVAMSGLIYFLVAICLIFIMDFIRRSDFWNKIREE